MSFCICFVKLKIMFLKTVVGKLVWPNIFFCIFLNCDIKLVWQQVSCEIHLLVKKDVGKLCFLLKKAFRWNGFLSRRRTIAKNILLWTKVLCEKKFFVKFKNYMKKVLCEIFRMWKKILLKFFFVWNFLFVFWSILSLLSLLSPLLLLSLLSLLSIRSPLSLLSLVIL